MRTRENERKSKARDRTQKGERQRERERVAEQLAEKLKDDGDMCARPGNRENLNRFMLLKIIHMHACI